jgi:uncharacterized membrane protein YkvA (DUF1232 family)
MSNSEKHAAWRERIRGLFQRSRKRVSSRTQTVKERVTNLDASAVKRRLETMDADAVQEQLSRIDPGFLDVGAADVTDRDVQRVVQEADAIESRFHRDGPLERLLDDGRLLLRLVQDAWNGSYRRVPRWTLSAAVFTLLYVLNPLDLVPDAIPVVGALDDAAVVSLALLLMEQDLLAYRTWRQRLLEAPETKPLPDIPATE